MCWHEVKLTMQVAVLLVLLVLRLDQTLPLMMTLVDTGPACLTAGVDLWQCAAAAAAAVYQR